MRKRFQGLTFPRLNVPPDTYFNLMEQYIVHGRAAALQSLVSCGVLGVANLTEAMQSPCAFDDYDRRALEVLMQTQYEGTVCGWLQAEIRHPGASRESILECFRKEWLATGRNENDFIEWLANYGQEFLEEDGPTVLGRYLLGAKEEVLLKTLKTIPERYVTETGFMALMLTLPEKRAKAAIAVAMENCSGLGLCRLLCGRDAKKYEEEIAKLAGAMKTFEQVEMAEKLLEVNRERFGPLVEEAAMKSVREGMMLSVAVRILLHMQGEKAVPTIATFMQRTDLMVGAYDPLLKETVERLGLKAGPILASALTNEDHAIRLEALECMKGLDAGELGGMMGQALREGLASPARTALKYLAAAAAFRGGELLPDVRKRLRDKSKLVREAAAEAVAKHDPEAMSCAAELLAEQSAAARGSGIHLLAQKGTEGRELLVAHFERETDEENRRALAAALKAVGVDVAELLRKRAPADRAAIRQAAAKISKLGIAWIKEEELPPLAHKDGSSLDGSEVRYLLFRQSNQKECAPDLEAFPLYEQIDRRSSGEFGLKILTLFTQAGAKNSDAWALVTAAMLGDARMISSLGNLVRRWSDESSMKLAQWGLEALTLNGSNAALAGVEAISMKFRTSSKKRHKTVAEAAQRALAAAAGRLGISLEELGDRIVPWLGFEPGQRRTIEAGPRVLEATIGLDFKLQLKDTATGKRAVSIPKAAPAEVQAEFKGLAALARDVGKAQTMRLENLMVSGHRWNARRWKELFLKHPLLLPFAVQQVWAVYGAGGKVEATFRAMEDRSLTMLNDEPFDLPDDASVGLVHPVELDEAALTAWREHMADYEITSPIPQVDRPVARISPELAPQLSYDTIKGMKVSSMSVRGKGQKRGWNIAARGGGGMGMQKHFPGGIEGFVEIEGLTFYFSPDPNEQVTFQSAAFFPATRGNAGDVESQPAVASIPLGELPPIVYSEAISDLAIMSGAGG